MGVQRLTAQSTVETELVAGALVTTETAFSHNMVTELGLNEDFKCVPLCIDNTWGTTYSRKLDLQLAC